MKHFMTALVAVLAVSGFLAGCAGGTVENGTVVLSMTDAPIDAENVTGVWIRVTGVEFLRSEEGTTGGREETLVSHTFETPAEMNLLELQNGNTLALGQVEVPSGHVSQIRFLLEAPVRGQSVPTNPGCYIEFTDGSTEPLFVPSADSSGFKAVGAFDVPVNGEVRITTDFDVRKSVVEAGSSTNGERYILKPVIRTVVENEAGKLALTVTGYTPADDGAVPVAYVYDGAWDEETETADPALEAVRFPSAAASATENAEGAFVFHFLAEGSYTVVLAEYSFGAEGAETFLGVLGTVENVEVTPNSTARAELDLTAEL